MDFHFIQTYFSSCSACGKSRKGKLSNRISESGCVWSNGFRNPFGLRYLWSDLVSFPKWSVNLPDYNLQIDSKVLSLFHKIQFYYLLPN